MTQAHATCGRYGRGAALAVLVLTSGSIAAAQRDVQQLRLVDPNRPVEWHWVKVTVDNVRLRALPDLNSTSVASAPRDTPFQCTGMIYEWHELAPPPGTFVLASAAHIQTADGRSGVVKTETGALRLRAGSTISTVDPNLAEVVARLESGATVEILGREGDWLRIAPPEGVRFYVFGDYVTRIDDAEAARLVAGSRWTATQPIPPPSSQPAAPPPVFDLSGPWGAKLREIEPLVYEEARKPIAARNWRPLLERLAPFIAQQEDVPAARLAAAWVQVLNRRIAEQAEYAASKSASQPAAAPAARP